MQNARSEPGRVTRVASDATSMRACDAKPSDPLSSVRIHVHSNFEVLRGRASKALPRLASSAKPLSFFHQQSATMAELTPDEIFFTNVFNAHRAMLTGFAHCQSREELHIIRDGWLLALASDLCPAEYEPVRNRIVLDPKVAAGGAAGGAGGASSDDGEDDNDDKTDEPKESTADAAAIQTNADGGALARTVTSARKSPAWDNLTRAVKAKAYEVGSDLDAIWMSLENGRMQWLEAASAAHPLKTMLQTGLENQCGGAPTEGDVSDAKMIWMYALSLNVPTLKAEREAWQKVVQMEDGTRPLVGYKAELWDARLPEWAPLDLGVQAAAEAGGSNIEEAWKAR